MTPVLLTYRIWVCSRDLSCCCAKPWECPHLRQTIIRRLIRSFYSNPWIILRCINGSPTDKYPLPPWNDYHSTSRETATVSTKHFLGSTGLPNQR